MNTYDPQKRTHPADGLYFLSPEILIRVRACGPHRTLWVHKNGGGEVPVTLERLVAHATVASRSVRCIGNGMPWLLNRMLDEKFITNTEYAATRKNIFTVDAVEAARKVMDALYMRAERENHPGLQR